MSCIKGYLVLNTINLPNTSTQYDSGTKNANRIRSQKSSDLIRSILRLRSMPPSVHFGQNMWLPLPYFVYMQGTYNYCFILNDCGM